MVEKADLEVDLLVVGSGIYGAWSAYDASLRGLKVLIIDKGDIANATSSASSKLIHGGLRYLEQLNFSLVKKSVKERQLLFDIAPHRVKPLKFAIPVYSKSRIPAWKYKIGLSIYDWFAGIESTYRHKSYTKNDFLEENPFLKKHNLKKGLSYFDAGTDDFRYTLEIIDGAVQKGAELRTYCSLKSYQEENGKVSGAIIEHSDGKSEQIKCKAVINATGQWTDKLLTKKYCRLSKGVHLILPDCGLQNALLLLAPSDGRVFFIIPWYGKTMVGTTDTDFESNIDDVKTEEVDINYLLESVNHYLTTPFSKENILGSFAGLRVLKNEDGHPSSVTRDWECKEEKPGLFVSIGGKYTSARHDSSLMVDRVCHLLDRNSQCSTASIKFPWAVNQFQKWKKELKARALKMGLSENIADLLINRQGQRAEKIIASIEETPELSQTILPELPFTLAEWEYSIREEYVRHWNDLIRRRFPITLIHRLTESEELKLKNSANQIMKSMGRNTI